MKKTFIAVAIGVVIALAVRAYFAERLFAQHKNNTPALVATAVAGAPTDPMAEDSSYLHDNVELFNSVDTPLLYRAAVQMVDSSEQAVKLSWDALTDVKFTKKYVKELDQKIEFPTFGKKVKALAGKKVRLTGYVIPLDMGGFYALSRNPFKSCFFCGGAGPESIVGIVFATPPQRYKTDDFLTFEGVFLTNDNDMEKLMYQLYAAKQVK
jgi:hypothetical protein